VCCSALSRIFHPKCYKQKPAGVTLRLAGAIDRASQHLCLQERPAPCLAGGGSFFCSSVPSGGGGHRHLNHPSLCKLQPPAC